MAKIGILTRDEREDLAKLADKAREALSDLYGRVEEILLNMESEFGDKSERWQEGGAGQEARERIDSIEAWRDELPDPEFSDMPEGGK